MERSAGFLFCPRCFCRREFVAYTSSDGDPYPPIECVVCDFEFDKSRVEDPAGGPDQVIPTVPEDVRDAAREDYIREFSLRVARGGYRLRPIDKRILEETDG